MTDTLGTDQTTTPDEPRPSQSVISFQPTAAGERTAAPPPPVHPPAVEELPVDAESGFRYRPLLLGGQMFRCAARMPAGYSMEITRFQMLLAGKRPEDFTADENAKALDLMATLIEGVVWDDDIPKLQERLKDKRDPVDMQELNERISEVWTSVRQRSGLGNA